MKHLSFFWDKGCCRSPFFMSEKGSLFVLVEARFHLNQYIKDVLRSSPVPWGFGTFSEAVFYRTYSRELPDGSPEQWSDVVIRVTEGVMSIRKDWYLKNGIKWDEDYWQLIASEMATAMFNMHFLPAGRGLRSMGTDYVYERGSHALNNCGYTEVKDDLAYAAGWLMDSLMLGVGVGFSTANASFGEARIPDSDGSTTIVIPDSREGWVMSVEALINSYFRGPGKPVEFDYSHIRPEGSPIRGFGGIASGPEPLIKLHERLRGYLNQYATGEVDRTRLITDVMNAIGACVVAGNVRRSAELATGSLADSTFLNLKNYELNPDRAEIGWMCLPRDTWITTDQGPRQIRDLIGTPFNAVVDGKTYPSQGFFPSGEKEVVEIHAQGYVLRSSPEHKIMTTRGWVPAGNLAVGDLIRLHDHGSDLSWGGPGTEDEGFVLGAIVGDGWLTNDGTIIIGSSASDPGSKEFQEEFLRVVQQYPRFHKKRDYEWVPIAGKDELRLSCTSLKDLASQFGIEPGNKTLTPEIEGASREFYVGFLRGLFDTDGSIEVLGATKNARGVRLSNSDEQVIRGTQRMLSRLGIRSKVHEITTNHGFIKRKTPYALLIRGEHARRFGELIGFTNSRKAQLLAEQGVTRRSNKSHLARVERVVRTGTTEPMYDCMVEEVHAYDANGIYVSNSNNSVVLSESDHFLKLPEIADRIRDNGEPGVINLMNVQKYGRFKEKKPDLAVGFNPCAEIPLEHAELCNLAEVFPTRCSSVGEILKAMDLATIYASTVALLPSHRRDTNEVVERNRRIGVSISGVADWLDSTSVAHLTKILRTGYEDVVMPRNKLLAVEAGVPESVRLTTVKPSGTISQLVGVSPGMHWPVHRYYIRRMRVGHNSPIVELLISSGLPYEQDKWDPETLVFEFPQESGKGKTRSVGEVSIWEQASMVAFLQREWADNAVSNTLTFNPETEGKDIEKVLSMYAPQIKSMSMLPGSNDVYEQMPYERITRSEYLERMAKLKPIDWSVLRGNDGIDVKYCDGDVCELPT